MYCGLCSFPDNELFIFYRLIREFSKIDIKIDIDILFIWQKDYSCCIAKNNGYCEETRGSMYKCTTAVMRTTNYESAASVSKRRGK